jgi:hypothetical protein
MQYELENTMETLQDFHHLSPTCLTLWIHFQNTTLQRKHFDNKIIYNEKEKNKFVKKIQQQYKIEKICV